jgi:hypothetical protein
MAKAVWRTLKFIFLDWTVSPRMLSLNERRPVVYQLVTTPVITLEFGLLIYAVMLVLVLVGAWPGQ